MEYVIRKMRDHYREFALSVGASDAADINNAVRDNRIAEIIKACNEWHEQNIGFIANLIAAKVETRKIITVSGPSSSGKTTFAKKLDDKLNYLNIDTVTISMDDYYKPLKEMPVGSDGKPDMEDIEAIDYRLMNEHLLSLTKGDEIYLPSYSFIDKKRNEKARKVRLKDNDIIVVEGIHGLNPLIATDIPEKGKLKIYCSAISGLLSGDDGERISSELTRMIRRLCRDFYYRDADYIYTFDIWDKVEAGNVKNVFPYTASANVFFNSALPYEFCIMKKHAEKVLNNADAKGKYAKKIQQVNELISQFEGIPDSMVPEEALLNEFFKR